MLRRLAALTFSDAPSERRLFRLIEECDLDGTLSQEGAAHELNVSRRQFHRLRSQAVTMLAAQIERTLGHPVTGESTHPFEILAQSILSTKPSTAGNIYSLLGDSTAIGMRLLELRARVDAGELLSRDVATALPESGRPAALALVAQSQHVNGLPYTSVQGLLKELHDLWDRGERAFDETTRFELEYLNFLRQRSRSSVHEMRSSAQNLDRLAGSRPAWQARALVAKTEAAWRSGDDQARTLIATLHRVATQSHDVRRLGVANLFDAGLLMMNQQYRRADLSARAAALALEHYRPEGILAEAMLGRIRLMTSSTWDPKELLRETEGDSYDRLALRAIHARTLVAQGQFVLGRAYASEAFERAKAAGAPALAAHATITLASVLDHLGEADEAQRLYTNALTEFISVHDHVTAFDLFAVPRMPRRAFGPMDDVEHVLDVVLARIEVAIPNVYYGFDDYGHWRKFGRAMLNADARRATLADAVGAPAPRVTAMMVRHKKTVEDAFYFGAAVLLHPNDRPRFVNSVRSALNDLAPETPLALHA